MTIGTRRDPAVAGRATVPASKVQQLGSAGGFAYIVHDGQEYQLQSVPVSDPLAYVVQPGEVLISERTVEFVGGSRVEGTALRRALPVPRGTYRQLQQDEALRRGRVAAQRRARHVDVLDLHPVAASRGDTIMPVPSVVAANANRPRGDKALPALGLPDQRPGVLVPAVKAPRGAAGVLAWLDGKGIKVRATPAGLLDVRAPGGRLPPGVAEAIAALEPLLVAALLGRPLACGLPHGEAATSPPASRIAWPRLPICEAHYSGEEAGA